VLGRLDLLLFSVSAILTIDSLATAASMGVSWFTWWAITMTLFFVPYGLVTAELGAAWPAEGGLYVWVREAMGPRWGAVAAWLYWINNAYWIPAVYTVFAGTFHAIFLKSRLPPSLQEGAGAIWLQTGIAIVVTWLTVWIGIVRLKVSKWLPNVGAVVKVAIFLGLGALGLGWLLAGRSPANEFSLAQLVPRWSDSLAFLPVLVYNALGFELMSSAGDEMREPQQDVPRAVLLSGVIIAVVYTLGVLGILLAVPLQELSLTTGTWDALVVLGRQAGTAAGPIVFLLGLGFLYACVANIVTWSLGVNRVAATAAFERMMPAPLARLHPRFGTPYVAFIVMGVISSVLLAGNALLADTPSNLFWMIFKLSGICFLLSYLLLFPAFVLLRRKRPEQPRPYRMPGGLGVATLSSVFCWLFIALACVLFFKPSPTAESAALAVRESWILVVETLATIVVGLLLIPRPSRR
jgi:amino acid transporter